MTKILLFFTFISLQTNNIFAQLDTTKLVSKSFDDGAISLLKRDGKIYTAIAVLSIILIGLFIYLWRLDKKISKLEK